MTHASSLTSLALLPLRQGVLLPGTTVALPIGREQSLALVESVEQGAILAVVPQRDPTVEDPTLADLLPVATRARVVSVHRGKRGARLVLEGLDRAELVQLTASHPYWRADVRPAEETGASAPETAALASTLRDRLAQAELGEELARRLRSPRATERGPGGLADVVASVLPLSQEAQGALLTELDVPSRLRTLLHQLAELRTLSELKSQIDQEIASELGKAQRDVLLRQQLRAIREELGEEEEDAIEALRQRLEGRELPEEVRRAVDRELDRLATLPPGQAEHPVLVKYLELIADLPWDRRADLNGDLDAIAATLDADHHGLEEVKRRILEHLAVAQMTGDRGGAILCLVGPPGVGKTSLGQSIADATGRPFVRVSLGGVRDEAEIRGHRRTYVGALPGRIVNALRHAGARNPVVLLDEIDKLGQGWMGSPEAALLEVLDPEQNATFTDHFLELPFDLSEVLFVCTANGLDSLSPPLRDRLEILELEGYTGDEKRAIARRHLLPKQLAKHGLTGEMLHLEDDALDLLVDRYTREAGVRQLTRELAKICRAAVLDIARRPDEAGPVRAIDAAEVRRILGKERFVRDAAERAALPGVVTGLAWTPVGGDILFVESTRMPGKGRLETTGQLGEVMVESARAALSYVRSHAGELGVDPRFLDDTDLHVHVPAGAVPKDGPSAGVTIFTALTSLLSNRAVRPDTAMTGECTLRGRVLPVGGIKSKLLAAHRAGLTRVILPAQNERDLGDLPADVRDQLDIVLAHDMREVLEHALEPAAHAPALPVPANDAHASAPAA